MPTYHPPLTRVPHMRLVGVPMMGAGGKTGADLRAGRKQIILSAKKRKSHSRSKTNYMVDSTLDPKVMKQLEKSGDDFYF